MNFKHLWLEAHSNEVHPENPKLEEKGKGLRKWHPNTQIIEEKAQRKGFLPLPSGIFDPNTSSDASKRRPKSNASTNQDQIRNTWTNKSSSRSQHTHTYDLLQKKLQRSEDPNKWKWKGRENCNPNLQRFKMKNAPRARFVLRCRWEEERKA